MLDIERQAADSNTNLQLQGSAMQLKKATESLKNAMMLAGKADPQHVSALTQQAREMLVMTVALLFQTQTSGFKIAQMLGITEDLAARLLTEFLTNHRDVAREMFAAERDLQGLQ